MAKLFSGSSSARQDHNCSWSLKRKKNFFLTDWARYVTCVGGRQKIKKSRKNSEVDRQSHLLLVVRTFVSRRRSPGQIRFGKTSFASGFFSSKCSYRLMGAIEFPPYFFKRGRKQKSELLVMPGHHILRGTFPPKCERYLSLKSNGLPNLVFPQIGHESLLLKKKRKKRIPSHYHSTFESPPSMCGFAIFPFSVSERKKDGIWERRGRELI